MTFVVTESCIRCKYTDCVEACPAGCFHEGENMLVINPDECIDCGLCEPTCPVEAILPDSYPEAEEWLEHNREYSAKWPKLLDAKPAMEAAKSFHDVPAKYANYFSPAPAGPVVQ